MWIKTIDNCLIRLEDISYIHAVMKTNEDNIEVCIITNMKNECMDKVLYKGIEPTLELANIHANAVLDAILYNIEKNVAFIDWKEI